MQIVFYTPPVERKGRVYTYLPHLVEHCAGRDKELSSQDYFTYQADLQPEFLITHTSFTFPDDERYEETLSLLTQPLATRVITKEQEMLHQEIADYPTKNDSLEKTVENDLYGDGYQEDELLEVTPEEIIAYHQQRYQPAYALGVTEQFELLLPEQYHKIPKQEMEITKHPISFQSTKGWYICGSHTSWETYWTLLFTKELLSEYTRYRKRYQEISQFDYTEVAMRMSKDHRIVAYPETACTDIPEEFLVAFRSYFVDHLFLHYDTSPFGYYNLIEKGTLTKEMILEMLSTFDEEIRDFVR